MKLRDRDGRPSMIDHLDLIAHRKNEAEIALRQPRALSISRPWPYCILHLGKLLENRSRKDGKEPKALTRYRGELYIHAAKSWDPSVADSVYADERCGPKEALTLADKSQHVAGAIVGKCRVVAHIEPDETVWVSSTNYRQTREQEAESCRLASTLNLRWWQGNYALVLDDVVAFDEAIPCTGRLSIWKIPADVRKRVLAVMETRKYKCRICGSVTSGRSRPGDRLKDHPLKYYPRRHRRFGGSTCPGSFDAATIVRPP